MNYALRNETLRPLLPAFEWRKCCGDHRAKGRHSVAHLLADLGILDVSCTLLSTSLPHMDAHSDIRIAGLRPSHLNNLALWYTTHNVL